MDITLLGILDIIPGTSGTGTGTATVSCKVNGVVKTDREIGTSVGCQAALLSECGHLV